MTTREQIIEIDKRYVWHPYTAMDEYIAHTEPLVIQRAEGACLYDMDGRSYIDANSSWWTMLLGHNHPRLLAALARQSARYCHVPLAGIAHEQGALLAQELVAAAPSSLTKVFFSDDGSTAVEVAIKLVLQFWAQNGRPRRRRFVALDGAFHGETLGVTALGGVEIFRRPFAGAVMECVHVPLPDGPDFGAAFGVIERVVREGSDSLAAVVLEPIVQGAGGMRIYPPEYLRRVRELTREEDVILVLDEVFTGYGRTGPMWASEHAGISPDVLCTAKGFSGGLLPMAATLVTERLFAGFLGGRSRAFHYGHTFCGNPLGAAVARAVLEVYRDERILQGAVPKAARIKKAFESFGAHPAVARARSLGMLGALDLVGGEGYLAGSGWRVYEEALRRGAYLRPLGNTVYIAPPLNIEDTTLGTLLEIVGDAVEAASAPVP